MCKKSFSIYFLLTQLCLIYCSPSWGQPLDNLIKGTVIPLRSALLLGIEKNLDIKASEINISIQGTKADAKSSEFDATLETTVSAREDEEPSASAFSTDTYNNDKSYGANIALKKKFHSGLNSQISLATDRSVDNSSIDALMPHYNDSIILDLSQPLLRDMGAEINTAGLRISTNGIRLAANRYISHAQGVAKEIEMLYFDLTKGWEILEHRMESRRLALELLSGNQGKFKAGIVPVTEVQEAETAVVARDEQVLLARQNIEILSNQLKNFLEIRLGNPMDKGIFKPEGLAPVAHNSVYAMKQALSIAFEKRLDLKNKQLEITNQNINLKYHKNQRLPRLDLKATLGLNGLSGDRRAVNLPGITSDPSPSPYEGSYDDAFSSMIKGDGYEYYFGLHFSYPIGNRLARANYLRAVREKRQTICNLKRLEGRIETEVQNAMVSVKRSLERVEVAEQFMSLAGISLCQEMERLKKGLSDTFRVLTFQDNLLKARIRRITALTDVMKGLAQLYHVMGTNLERYNILIKINMEALRNEG